MSTLLELPAIRERATRLSVEEYHRLGEMPVELLRGTIVDKMSKTPLHRFSTHRLRAILDRQLPSGCVLFSEAPMTLADSEPEPDLFIARGTDDDFRTTHPTSAELVIEVAVSSLEIDRVKALIYAESRVPEYWIVRPVEKSVEIYLQPGPEGYAVQRVAGRDEILESSALPGLKVLLA